MTSAVAHDERQQYWRIRRLGTVDISAQLRSVRLTGRKWDQRGQNYSRNCSVPLMPLCLALIAKMSSIAITCWDLLHARKYSMVGAASLALSWPACLKPSAASVIVLKCSLLYSRHDDEERRSCYVSQQRIIQLSPMRKLNALKKTATLRSIATTEKGEQSFSGEYVLMAVSRRPIQRPGEGWYEQDWDTDLDAYASREKETIFPASTPRRSRAGLAWSCCLYRRRGCRDNSKGGRHYDLSCRSKPPLYLSEVASVV